VLCAPAGTTCGRLGRDRPAPRAQETLFAHLGPQAPRPPPAAGGAPKYVALLSGLGVGEGGDPARLALAVDYLAGFLGGAAEQALAAQVPAPGPAGAQRARARPRSGAGEGLGGAAGAAAAARMRGASGVPCLLAAAGRGRPTFRDCAGPECAAARRSHR